MDSIIEDFVKSAMDENERENRENLSKVRNEHSIPLNSTILNPRPPEDYQNLDSIL